MGKERSEADKRIAERRAQAEELQRLVSPIPASLPSLVVPFYSSSHCEQRAVISMNITERFPFFSQMTDHLKRSKVALQKLLDEYWALRRKTCECFFVIKAG